MCCSVFCCSRPRTRTLTRSRSWQARQCRMRRLGAPPTARYPGDDLGCVPALLLTVQGRGERRRHPGEVRRGEDAAGVAPAGGTATSRRCGPHGKVDIEISTLRADVLVGRHGRLPRSSEGRKSFSGSPADGIADSRRPESTFPDYLKFDRPVKARVLAVISSSLVKCGQPDLGAVCRKRTETE